MFPEEAQLMWTEQTLPKLTNELEHFDTLYQLEKNMLQPLAELSQKN